MKTIISMLSFVVIVIVPITGFAHGGGTDKYGCHNERSTGHYHCHRGNKSQSDC